MCQSVTDCVVDNWDLSVKRATSVVRVLEKDFGVPPQRMTAAGRSSYAPLLENDSPSNRAKNRRTRIVVLPKLDQFYDLIKQRNGSSSISFYYFILYQTLFLIKGVFFIRNLQNPSLSEQ